MASILDVAKAANVAPSTVSLVANGHPRVAAETRRRVEQAIKRMGYRPRSARRKKRHIGVLYGRGMVINHELVDYCRYWIDGIRTSFGDKGADVNVNTGCRHVDEDLMFTRSLEKGDYDGVILMGTYPADGYIERTLQTHVPLVVMNQLPEHAEFSSVGADAFEGAQLALRHLMDLGHRRIAALIPNRSYGVAARIRQGIARMQATEPELTIVDFPQLPPAQFERPETFRPRARHLIEAGVTACFTGDPAALRMADALADLGMRVPEDISVLGWDDLGYVTQAGCRLTSIGYDKRTMGLLAGQMLQNLFVMKKRLANLTATVRVQLVPGQTTAPCRTA